MEFLGRFNINIVFIILGLVLRTCVECVPHRRIYKFNGEQRRILGETTNKNTTSSNGIRVFDVTNSGAKGDGRKYNTVEFMKTWQDACKGSNERAKFLVPKGTFIIGPVVFQGPCKGSKPIIIEVKGTVQARADLSEYSEDAWILFQYIDGMVLTGGGTFHGKGSSAWKYNDCKTNKDCVRPPTSIKLIGVKNAIIHDIHSVDSKSFHFHITDCSEFTAHNVKITAPGDSPNTDGMHISNTNKVNVSSIIVGTGDDCISIGQGVTQATIKNITCGPGHGLSIGSLGRRQNEADVNGITITNCTLSGTTNGARIKTLANSPPGNAMSITFEDIIMDRVANPIIIDQKYAGGSSSKSRVKVKDVHFKKIRGTTTSDVAVKLECSSVVPCQGIELTDIDLALEGSKSKSSISSCSNAKVTYRGKQNPAACEQ